ncbi:hypothetical protein [Acinetobacter tianfuensis]|uniref:hypothetical protein n=1 Tax=Acinetobacter tianfuensis TaxID=2419603 RepID=UPI001D192A62|nr:hypothetical protein [Acinetobacter tianfuensis]
MTSSIQYFDKYYERGQTNQLVLDRVAQDLAKSPNVDHNLVNKLIELHQNYLINFDRMIFLFDEGIQYISYKKGEVMDLSKDLFIKPFLYLSPTPRRYVLMTGYFIFAFLGGMLFLVVINSTGIQVVINLAFIVISLVFIALALLCLVLEDRLKNASDFIKELKKADKKYMEIERPRTIILLSGNNKKL